MSRSTATTMTTNSAITTPRPFHLIAQHGDSGAALILSSGAYPNRSIEITREALGTFRWFMQYALYIAKGGGSELAFRTQPDKLVKMPHDALMNIFYFLYADIAQLLTRQCVVPVRPLSSLPGEQEELGHLALSLRLTSSKITQPNLFFFDYKLGHLSNASLNADLEIVQRIIVKTKPEKLRMLLSTKTTVIITHLGIERTGTPLQMALYSHDEIAFKMLADQMNPKIVTRQCQEVFNNYGVRDYGALIKKQIDEADKLGDELEAAFARTSATDITNALDRVAGTTSALLQDALNRFNINLDRYVRANFVHNPYILQRLFEIYDRLHYDCNAEHLLSQQAIGSAQKLSSARWLQHYAQGVYYLGHVDRPEAAAATFFLRDASPVADIRTVGGLSRLGVDSCIDIFGRWAWAARRRGDRRGGGLHNIYQNLCQAKTENFQKLCSERKCSCAAPR